MCKNVVRLPWSTIREQLADDVADLRSAIDDELSGLPDTELFVATYSYGNTVLNDGRFAPPCPGTCPECQALFDSFDGDIPLALLLDNCVEVFLPYRWDTKNPRNTPLRVIGRGEMFGVFETLDVVLGTPHEAPPWGVAAGIRSVWVLAPLGNEQMMKRFFTVMGYSKAGWKDGDPHWKLVQSFANKKAPWCTKVVVFPRTVIEQLRRRRDGTLFKLLLETGWRQSSSLRHSAIQDADLHELINPALDTFGGELYHFATIRHWLNIVNGAAPVFCAYWKFPDAGGPFRELEESLADLLKEWESPYHPVILRPGMLGEHGLDAGYYSVRCPSVPGPSISERAYTEMIDRFDDVLRASHLFPEGTVQCFAKQAKVAANEKIPPLRGLSAAPAADLLKTPDAHQVYWGSPFFVAGAGLSRAATRVSPRALARHG